MKKAVKWLTSWAAIAVGWHMALGSIFFYLHLPEVGWSVVGSNAIVYCIIYICAWGLFLGLYILDKVIRCLFREDKSYVW